MKSQIIRSVLTTVGLAGALLGAVHVAQATQTYFLNAPGSLTKTDVSTVGNSVTATETLAATGATLNITANHGPYASQQSTAFAHSASANTYKGTNVNTTDGDIVHLAPPGSTATLVNAGIVARTY